MDCKFCGQELPEGETLCPSCGKENAQPEVQETVIPVAEEIAEPAEETVTEAISEGVSEPEVAEETTVELPAVEPDAQEAAPVAKKKLKGWQIGAVIAGGVVLVALLAYAILMGLGIDLTPKSNELSYKSDYTVSAGKIDKELDEVVVELGENKMTNADLQLYYWFEVNNFISYYSGYLESVGVDMSVSLGQQFYDTEKNMTWQQMFLDNAISSWQQYAVLRILAEKENVSLDADTRAYLDGMKQQLTDLAVSKGFENADAMLQNDMGNAFTVDSYVKYMEDYYISLSYYQSMYKLLTPSEDEINAHYQENLESYTESGVVEDGSKYVDVRHILICPQGGTKDEVGTVTYSEEEWEACREAAQALLDQWRAGDATEDSFAALAVEKSEDPGSAEEGGLYVGVTVGQMVEPFEDWCFDESREYADTGLVKTNYGYHIMFFVDSEATWHYNARMDILNERINEKLQAASEEYPMDVNFKKIALAELKLANG